MIIKGRYLTCICLLFVFNTSSPYSYDEPSGSKRSIPWGKTSWCCYVSHSKTLNLLKIPYIKLFYRCTRISVYKCKAPKPDGQCQSPIVSSKVRLPATPKSDAVWICMLRHVKATSLVTSLLHIQNQHDGGKRRVVKINNDRRGRSLHRGTARTKMYACVEQKICECTRTIGLWQVKTSGFWADYQMLWYHCTLESHRTLESSIYKIFVSTC